MTETLLSFSNILLFGRKVEDFRIVTPPNLPNYPRISVKAASTADVDISKDVAELDGEYLKDGRLFLLAYQKVTNQNGLYRRAALNPPVKVAPGDYPTEPALNILVFVRRGTVNEGKTFTLDLTGWAVTLVTDIDTRHGPFAEE